MKYLQHARLATRIFFLGMLIVMPAASWYLSHLPGGDIKEIQDEGYVNLQSLALAAIDGVAHAGLLTKDSVENTSQENQAISDSLASVNGDIWSARLWGVEWLDALAWAELSVVSKSIVLPLLAGGLFVLIFTALCGRVFCSWICPAGFIFAIADRIRKKIEAYGISLRDLKFKRWHKYVLLLTGLFVALISGLPLLGYFYPPALLSRELHSMVYAFFDNAREESWFGCTLVFSGISLFLFALLAFEVFVSRRFWCRYVCAGGALYSLIGRFRLFRIKRVKAACTDCGACNRACPMGLHPMTDALGIECDNCFACHAACPEGALPIKFTQNDVSIDEAA